jgi:sugar lactone lactonase YvrE
MEGQPQLVVDGLKFPEGLRWHDDRLWFSDLLNDGVFSWNEPSGQILLVRPDGEHQLVASGLACPNGMVITADGSTLVVAETYRSRLVAFLRAPDGSLSNRRVVATLDEDMADGLTSDSDGCYWVGAGSRFVRVDAEGRVVQAVEVPGYRCIACMLGSTERRTLYLAVCRMTMETFVQRQSVGRILALEIDVPGAGLP